MKKKIKLEGMFDPLTSDENSASDSPNGINKSTQGKRKYMCFAIKKLKRIKKMKNYA